MKLHFFSKYLMFYTKSQFAWTKRKKAGEISVGSDHNTNSTQDWVDMNSLGRKWGSDQTWWTPLVCKLEHRISCDRNITEFILLNIDVSWEFSSHSLSTSWNWWHLFYAISQFHYGSRCIISWFNMFKRRRNLPLNVLKSHMYMA